MAKMLYGTEEDLKDFGMEETAPELKKDVLAQYDATLKGYAEGSIVKGSVVRISEDLVFVDIHFKSEGMIP